MKARYRSRLMGLPAGLRYALGETSYQIGMSPEARKQRCLKAFSDFGVPVKDIGTGTNRFAVRYDGYVIKIGLDSEGVADNKQEWVMSPRLAPNVAPAHEISKGGHLLVASYAPAFSNLQEFMQYRHEIIQILQTWGRTYLLGDVGLTRKNYANWSLLNGRPVCNDYAYIFPADMDLFTCICGSKDIHFSDNTFSEYKCAKCGTLYPDRDLRMKISNETRLRLFENVSEDSIWLTQPEDIIEVSDSYMIRKVDPDAPDPFVAMEFANARLGFPK